MPCLNSSGNVASDVSSTPNARIPFQVKATVTQRLSCSTVARNSAADFTLSRIAASQARPPPALRNDRNSYRPVSAGARDKRMCWMSSNSSTAGCPIRSLDQVIRVAIECLSPGPGCDAPRSASLRSATVKLLVVHLNVMVAAIPWCLRRSLHLIEHVGERRLEPEGLLDLIRAHVGILPVFQEAGAMVLADEFDERRGVRLPILRETV